MEKKTFKIGDKLQSESIGNPTVTITGFTANGDYITDELDFHEAYGESYFVIPKNKAVEPTPAQEQTPLSGIHLKAKVYSELDEMPSPVSRTGMSLEEIKAEVQHIFDSGANEIRVVSLIEKLLSQQQTTSIEPILQFAMWYSGMSYNKVCSAYERYIKEANQ